MNEPDNSLRQRFQAALGRLVFLGFNSYVIALDRDTGELVWQWVSPQGRSSYVALLLDGDRLIASVQGYTYCLNPLSGEQVWANPLKGFGTGVPALVSLRGASSLGPAAAEELAEQDRQSNQSGQSSSMHSSTPGGAI